MRRLHNTPNLGTCGNFIQQSQSVFFSSFPTPTVSELALLFRVAAPFNFRSGVSDLLLDYRFVTSAKGGHGSVEWYFFYLSLSRWSNVDFALAPRTLILIKTFTLRDNVPLWSPGFEKAVTFSGKRTESPNRAVFFSRWKISFGRVKSHCDIVLLSLSWSSSRLRLCGKSFRLFKLIGRPVIDFRFAVVVKSY